MKTILNLIAASSLFAAPIIAQTPRYTVTDLGPVGPYGQPFALSTNGLISGDALTKGAYHAVLWYGGQKLDIGQFGFGGPNSIAFTINVKAQAVGQAETSISEPYGEDFCGFGTNLVCLPFFWQNGLMIPLPTLGGKSGAANMINSRGEVAGLVENTTREAACPPPQVFQFKPVIWVTGVAQELPTVHGDPVGGAFGLNENGQVVGASGLCGVFSPYYLANIVPLHPVIWQNGTATDLGSLGGTGGFAGNIAFSVNNKGQVVGNSDLPGDTTNHGFLWENGHMADLGTLPGDVISAALAISDSGDVVGVSEDQEFNARAAIWQNGVIHDLNDLVPADSALYLLFACSINSSGEIIGQAADSTGEAHGFLLTPAAAAPAEGSISSALQTSRGRMVLSEDARESLQQKPRFGRFGVRPTGPR